MLPAENGIGEIFFDDALGEARVWVRSTPISTDFNSVNSEFLKKTGWKLVLMRSPGMITIIKEINDILKKGVEERAQFYKIVGEKIFRSKLIETVEASVIALGASARLEDLVFCLLLTRARLYLIVGSILIRKIVLPQCLGLTS